jgi:hypothetical protein
MAALHYSNAKILELIALPISANAKRLNPLTLGEICTNRPQKRPVFLLAKNSGTHCTEERGHFE